MKQQQLSCSSIFFFKKKKKVKANTELSRMKNSVKNESNCYGAIDSWFWEETMLQPSAVQSVLQDWHEIVILETQETSMPMWW